MGSRRSIWVDFENAPHVLVLAPVIERLRDAGFDVVMTARDFGATLGLCEQHGFAVEVVGSRRIAKSSNGKAALLLNRAFRLRGLLHDRRRDLALSVSHISMSQIVASRLLGVRAVTLNDYEFNDQRAMRFVDELLVPFAIPPSAFGRAADKVVHYPGFKEEFYLSAFDPAAGRAELPGVGDRIAVLFRPGGRFTHYQTEATTTNQDGLIDTFAAHPNVYVVLMPRDAEQGELIAARLEQNGTAYWYPQHVLDGPSLIWRMDLVFSGGGTMTREAAVLGVPSYSFFGGPLGAVDRYLEENGRLRLLRNEADIAAVTFAHRERTAPPISDAGLRFVSERLVAKAQSEPR